MTALSASPLTGEPVALDAASFTLDNVGLTIGPARILSGITKRFEANRIYGLIGPNGAGKTSLVRILARHHEPSEGRVHYEGRPLGEWAARAFACSVAHMPQQLPSSQQLCVKDLVALGRYPWHGPFRRKSSADQAAIEEAMRVADVADFADRLVDTLSGGERQRVWVAMMVAQAGRFLLLDEPTAALDIAHQAHLLELLRGVARARRLGIVMAFHDINIAATFCDEVLAMKNGKLIASGTPAEIITPEILSAVYDIDMATMPHPTTGRPIGFIR